MTEHLPECPMLDQQWPKHPLEVCEYCDMIAACEQRVLDAIDLPAANVQYQKVGYAAGLDAAREAVAALDVPADWIGSTRHGLDNALAAIDALRGDAQ